LEDARYLEHGDLARRYAGIGRCAHRHSFCKSVVLQNLLSKTPEPLVPLQRTHALGIVASPLLPMLVFSTGLIVVLAAPRWQGWLGRRVDARLAATLGLMTYPLYLLHQEIGAALIAAQLRVGLPFGVAALATLGVVLGAAWWVVRVAEPVLRLWLAGAIDGAIAFSRRHAPGRDSRPSASPPAG
jgi:peptidoglycan/LPS O-acetylase OafA/YrhL